MIDLFKKIDILFAMLHYLLELQYQVTLEDQMICGALQTLNEEACEDVLEDSGSIISKGISGDIPHTTLIPPSPEIPASQSDINADETDFVILQTGPFGKSYWQPVLGSSAPASSASSGCSTPRFSRRIQHPPNRLEITEIVSPASQNKTKINKTGSASLGSGPGPRALFIELKDKLISSNVIDSNIPQLITSNPLLDSDDESTPLVSDISTPSASLGPTSVQNNAFSPQLSHNSSPTQQYSSPEAEHNKQFDNNLTDYTDFSPISPIREPGSRASSQGSLLSRQNALDTDNREKSQDEYEMQPK